MNTNNKCLYGEIKKHRQQFAQNNKSCFLGKTRKISVFHLLNLLLVCEVLTLKENGVIVLYRLFMQYVNSGVLQLTGDFMAQVLKGKLHNTGHVLL